MEKCIKCNSKAVISIGFERPLCVRHYVKEEEDECLKALLESNPDEEFIKEIKKQKPYLLS